MDMFMTKKKNRQKPIPDRQSVLYFSLEIDVSTLRL